MYAAARAAEGRTQGCVQPYPSPLVADRAVDLLRVNSALCSACSAPGCACCRV
ncbi:hypothetical protein ABZ357_30840 [Streptomyces sp. NPDC005917]|uniref:hypothetical protein n=1 Tax=Streptomyces sp. NPDC005917 TaxID=3155347 RepID=UPI0033DFF7F3